MPHQYATLLIISAEPESDDHPALATISDGTQTLAVSTAPNVEQAIRIALQTATAILTPAIASTPLDRPAAEVVARVMDTLDIPAAPAKGT